MTRRRSFGALRRLPSGRWKARYRGDDGRVRSAPATSASRAEAERFLEQMDLDRVCGGWVEPDAGAVPLATYVEQWLVERPEPLRPRTVELYRGLLRLHILSTFGPVHLNRITSAAVRSWHASLRQRGLGDSTVAKAYRLLKGSSTPRFEDDLVARNPCRPQHAGVERPDERRPPSLAEVDAVAAVIEPRFRLLVLLGAWSGLRHGELLGLTRQRIDPLHGVIHVREQLVQTADGRRFMAPAEDQCRRSVGRGAAAPVAGGRGAPGDVRRPVPDGAAVRRTKGCVAGSVELSPGSARRVA